MSNKEDTIFDKIGKLIDDHRIKKNQAILDILTRCIQDKFDDGTVEELIEEDQVRFELISLVDLNESLVGDGFTVVDDAYLERYLDEEFVLDGEMIVYEYDC
ncbi:MAG: hypothetical protein PHG66_00370 [Candidatus Colwellbacteria bacterium]|nr:hypothetical protein [Candidatus Colwellbacteria bacterium]